MRAAVSSLPARGRAAAAFRCLRQGINGIGMSQGRRGARGWVAAALVLLGMAGAPAPARAQGGQTAQRLAPRSVPSSALQYLLFLPRGYGRDARRWPVILYLHGGSARGHDLAKLKAYGLPKLLDQRPDFPFIVVSPQCPPGESWTDAQSLARLLDEVQARYRVDARRVYVTGVSMGGAGAWYLAFRHPGRFAAAAPVAAYDPNPYWASSGRLRGVPVWAFHGDRDTLAPVGAARSMNTLLTRAGGTSRLTVLQGRGHSITDVYDDARLYQWFLQHARPAPRPRAAAGR